VVRGDAADRGRHRRGEQRDLALGRGEREDLLDVLREPHAQHLVGLVEREEAHVVEAQGAPVEVVHDAAGRADDDLRAAGQRALLRQERGAAVDRDDLDAGQVPGEGLDGLGDLHRELTRRGQHEGLDLAELGVDRGEEREAERGGLAGTGLGDARDVAAGEQRRDGLGLDRGRRLETEVGDRALEGLGQPEVGEGGAAGGGRGQGGVCHGHVGSPIVCGGVASWPARRAVQEVACPEHIDGADTGTDTRGKRDKLRGCLQTTGRARSWRGDRG
jgi:hypothetical protein